jgi:hypothetical protein
MLFSPRCEEKERIYPAPFIVEICLTTYKSGQKASYKTAAIFVQIATREGK